MKYSQDIINTFFEEINELISDFEVNVNSLQENPQNKEVINKIYRNVHSIKGEAALMQFINFSTIAHKVEDMLSLIRDGKLAVDNEVIEILDITISLFYKILSMIKTAGSDAIDSDTILNKIAGKIGTAGSTDAGSADNDSIKPSIPLKDIKNHFKELNFKFLYEIEIYVSDIPMKYARAFLVYNNLTSAGDILFSTVDFMNEEPDENYAHFIIYLASDMEEGDVYNLTDVGDIKKAGVKVVPVTDDSSVNEKADVQEVKSNSIRVDIRKIDNLMDDIGEIIISYNKLRKFKDRISAEINQSQYMEFNDLLDSIKLIIDSMQDNVMRVRMIPIKVLFNKLPRLVNEIAGALNKDVNISFSGGDTEIDKTVIDELKEPLLHIIRNSIDHGIETPQERAAMGKPEQGRVTVSAYQSGNNIVINVEDDGRGIDIGKIRKKVIEKELLSEAEALRAAPAELLRFIFSPGFSTKDQVSEISGRGVGMDVVKNSIESLRGSIKISSKRNFGTKISIILPLTIAITNSLIVFSRGFYFAIPLYFIVETLRVLDSELEFVESMPFLNMEEEVIPLLYLDKILNLKDYAKKQVYDESDNKRNKVFIVLVRAKGKKVGLIIDKLIGEQYIVVKPLENVVENFKGLSGATVLGDGSIAYILDPTLLIG